MKPFTTFYFVRHCETEWNKEQRLQGQGDSPLTKDGIKETKEFVGHLTNVQASVIYSSDLPRAYLTARLISSNLQLPHKKDKALRARFGGMLQGQCRKEVKGNTKILLYNLDRFTLEKKIKSGLNIECNEEIVLRLLRFVKRTSNTYPNQHVLVITHGGIMRVFLSYLGYAKLKNIPPFSIPNNGYYVFRSNGQTFEFVKAVGIKVIRKIQ